MATTKCPPFLIHNNSREVARLLLVDSDATARLTLRTVLQAGGYRVDTASSASEAIEKMSEEEYALVLSDLHSESSEAELRVITYANAMDYRPATALITSWREEGGSKRAYGTMLIKPENVPELLEQVAELIGERASRRLVGQMRHGG